MLLLCPTISAIGLTEFTKHLVTLYISTYQVPNNEDMVVHTNTDTLCYRAFLYSIDTNELPLGGPEYLGKVKHNKRYVYLFGQQNDLFHIGGKVVSSELKARNKLDDNVMINFDPIEWEIIIDKKDLKLNKQLTNSNIIIDIQDGQIITGMDSAILVQLERIVSTCRGK